MRIKNEVPNKTGMYLFKSTKVEGDFSPCIIIVDETGFVGEKGSKHGLFLGKGGLVSIDKLPDRSHVEWIGPFTVYDILGIPDNDSHNGEQK